MKQTYGWANVAFIFLEALLQKKHRHFAARQLQSCVFVAKFMPCKKSQSKICLIEKIAPLFDNQVAFYYLLSRLRCPSSELASFVNVVNCEKGLKKSSQNDQEVTFELIFLQTVLPCFRLEKDKFNGVHLEFNILKRNDFFWCSLNAFLTYKKFKIKNMLQNFKQLACWCIV